LGYIIYLLRRKIKYIVYVEDENMKFYEEDDLKEG
jgi:hypothetical protein